MHKFTDYFIFWAKFFALIFTSTLPIALKICAKKCTDKTHFREKFHDCGVIIS